MILSIELTAAEEQAAVDELVTVNADRVKTKLSELTVEEFLIEAARHQVLRPLVSRQAQYRMGSKKDRLASLSEAVLDELLDVAGV